MVDSELLGGLDIGGMVSGGIDVAYTVMLVVLIPLIFAAVIYGVWFIMQFKHVIVLDLVTGSKNVMRIKKFRERKGRKGTRWQIFGSWEHLPPAPEGVVKVNNKGNMFVELAYTAEGNYQWKNKKVIPQMFKRVDAKGNILPPIPFAYIDNDTDEMVIRPEETFTTLEKQWFIDELSQAEARRKNMGFWQTHGATVAVGFMFLMALAILIFGAEEVFKPVIQAQENYVRSQEMYGNALNDYKDLSARMERIESGIQQIEAEPGG